MRKKSHTPVAQPRLVRHLVFRNLTNPSAMMEPPDFEVLLASSACICLTVEVHKAHRLILGTSEGVCSIIYCEEGADTPIECSLVADGQWRFHAAHCDRDGISICLLPNACGEPAGAPLASPPH